jgi:hypothetical protein
MRIVVHCPGCRKEFRMRPETAGQEYRCPSCQSLFAVPAAADNFAADPPVGLRPDQPATKSSWPSTAPPAADPPRASPGTPLNTKPTSPSAEASANPPVVFRRKPSPRRPVYDDDPPRTSALLTKRIAEQARRKRILHAIAGLIMVLCGIALGTYNWYDLLTEGQYRISFAMMGSALVVVGLGTALLPPEWIDPPRYAEDGTQLGRWQRMTAAHWLLLFVALVLGFLNLFVMHNVFAKST